MSIALVALIVLLAMDLRMGVAIPPGFVEEFTDTVNKRKFKEAFDLAKDDDSFLGRVLTAGMSRLQYGIEDAREAAFNMVESIKSSKEQLDHLPGHHRHARAAARPGRHGLRHDPGVHGAGKRQQPRRRLADSISHALVVTLLGIGLSVPAIFFHAFFRNRLTRISMDTATSPTTC